MHEAALRLTTIGENDPEDGVLQVELAATDGRFSAAAGFYTNAEYFSDFARALMDFPKTRADQAVFEIGSLTGNANCYARLRVYLRDELGHVAVEVQIDNRREDHHRAKAMFNIHCEAAASNRLGDSLLRWISAPGQPMIWQPEPERI
ncbi:MAG TPA: hypothetical protein VGB91_10155 [Rhizomicrobium sp.]